MKKRIWLSPPDLDGNEMSFVQDAFKTNWIAPAGPNIDEFELELENYYSNQKFVAALNSGTSAIHLALKLIGIETGDEVLCQSKTFTASANPILYENGIPVFIDSEKQSFNLCPEILEAAIKNRLSKGIKPKAIIAVHLYGMPYNADEINRISNHYNIPVIEDSAEASGSGYNSIKCGILGDFGILSFNGNKIITTSAGGALIVKTEDLKEKAIYLSTQANSASREFHHEEVGYNYRMSNVLAGIGRGQLEKIDEKVEKKRLIFKKYKKELSHIEELHFNGEPKYCYSNRWLTTALTSSFETRNAIIEALEMENIESRPFWKPLHIQPIFKCYPRFLNGTSEELYKTGICLPSGTSLNEEELDRIISVIKNCFKY